ncbi:hypothetical protein PG993_008182 [Apiospora rasikravindrae]|uniref:DUF1763-domain-containing protein n=1 Tax=Apiospora rasikravindrae TaxID=990691 RepID=A0ABR1T116_9PEZI
MANLEIIHAYRHLYRGLLHAVQFSKPARYVARHQLRAAFREDGAVFDPKGVAKTIAFLDAATRSRGPEHKVLKNLLTIAFHRDFGNRQSWRHVKLATQSGKKDTEFAKHARATAYKHYDMTIAMLNKSMGLCLR